MRAMPASSEISGTAASAFETGQSSFAASAASANAVSSSPGTSRDDAERDLRDPGPGHEGDGGVHVELLRRRARLGEAVRKGHREACGMRRGDELLRARAPVGLLGPRTPGDVERPEGATSDLRDRPRAVHERTRPSHVCSAVGHQPSSSSVASTVTRALALISAENGQPSSAACARSGERLGIGAGRDGAGCDVRGDDPVPRALDLVHRDRAAHVHVLRRSTRRGRARYRAT